MVGPARCQSSISRACACGAQARSGRPGPDVIGIYTGVDEIPGTAVPRKDRRHDRCRAGGRGHDPESRAHPRAHHRHRVLGSRHGASRYRSRVSSSSSWRRPTRSAALGATTVTRAAPAMCRRTCTRSRSSRRRPGANCSRLSRRSSTTSKASPTSTVCGATSGSTRAPNGAQWDDTEYRWHVFTDSGQEYVAQFLISGAGALHIPRLPDIEGLTEFQGPAFHSAQWDHSVDLTGKRVAVIGTGASAIQIVPGIIGEVAELQLYQRTPPWVVPRPNEPFPRWLKTAFANVPGLRLGVRTGIYWFLEGLGYAMTKRPSLLRAVAGGGYVEHPQACQGQGPAPSPDADISSRL